MLSRKGQAQDTTVERNRPVQAADQHDNPNGRLHRGSLLWPSTPPPARPLPVITPGNGCRGAQVQWVMNTAVQSIRQATVGTKYEGHLYLVGGVLRDRELGLPFRDDVDLVTELDAIELARYLHRRGLSSHHPVLYPRFGTARITVDECAVEIVTAREESYHSASRKPVVTRGDLIADVLRRDFTINTLMENVHTGEFLDLTGRGQSDLRHGLIKTPLDPSVTFRDDPLRMIRAIRFSARLGFAIDGPTWEGICEQAPRISIMGPGPHVVSGERIRDELIKIIQGPEASLALDQMQRTGLLPHFLPELAALHGVTQDRWHLYDVWAHTLRALDALPEDSDLVLRLGALFHDCGKPCTRSEDDRGIRFYGHPTIGAALARKALERLRFPAVVVRGVESMVRLHMRLGEYRDDWHDGAVRRMIRDLGEYRDPLLLLAASDRAAMRHDIPAPPVCAARDRMVELDAVMHSQAIESPLDGRQIMELLGIRGGPAVGLAKQYLVDQVIDGMLDPSDLRAARMALIEWHRGQEGGDGR